MKKKNNKYRLTLAEVSLKDASAPTQSLDFEFENHDNIFNIIEKVESKNIFENAKDAKEFAVGLKLFGEVLLRNRNHEVFSDLQPHFKDFMVKLKSYNG
ncbi:DUF3861 domain-containing protein [Aestuariibaculum sp. YM273]|uniref:DUF3861 domain-containing protein n=1 Tax=Aestuariibaculum sp. YM273 TaxID=3070659 RepID=UPI0027DD5FB3|nr:DUF3861 domain-containing protein [Aestuariibaculum sp. YM273]WMI66821.1 DUF3861 domain-containing protein [Aestuariibaculum sp. YM273]